MLKKFKKLAVSASVCMSSAVLLFGLLPGSAQALNFNQISAVYFFGDSLTDSGYNDLWPGRPVGKAPTFTTFGGYTWSQYIARDIKGYVLPVYPGPTPPDTITNNSEYPVGGFVSATLNGIDYAAAGSTTNAVGNGETWAPPLKTQISYFLATRGPTLDPNAVYFIWEGANDLLKLLPNTTELELLTTANNAATNIANAVTILSSRGAKRIVVLSLPNIGYTPLIQGAGSPTLPALMKTVTFTFNSMLNQKLGAVIQQTGVKVLYVDVYDVLDDVIAATKAGQPYVVAGQSFKFVNYNMPACPGVQAIDCPSTAPNNYIFADTLHPTDMAHRVLSLVVETEILNWQ